MADDRVSRVHAWSVTTSPFALWITPADIQTLDVRQSRYGYLTSRHDDSLPTLE